MRVRPVYGTCRDPGCERKDGGEQVDAGAHNDDSESV